MSIHMDSIMGKVSAYAKSAEGKKRMKEYIEQYRADGISKTYGGGKILTYEDMARAAKELLKILQGTAQRCDLPSSVMKHFYNMEVSKPQQLPDGRTIVYLYFCGDLHRNSLEDGEGGYTGEGINNIVALFNNGAHASDYVYGWWNEHAPTGYALSRSTCSDTFAWVRSKKDREALRFIQQAVNDFNARFGSVYHAVSFAGDDYQSP